MTQVPSIYRMAADADQREGYREAIDRRQEDLDGDDRIDKTSQQLLGEDGVLLYQFRKVVKARSCDGSKRLGQNRRKGALPMASVRKPKPNKTPAYPISGKTHMIYTY